MRVLKTPLLTAKCALQNESCCLYSPICVAAEGKNIKHNKLFLFHLLLFLQAMKSPELKERLEESEKLIQEMTVTWEEKLRKTEEIAQVCCFLSSSLPPFFMKNRFVFFVCRFIEVV